LEYEAHSMCPAGPESYFALPVASIASNHSYPEKASCRRRSAAWSKRALMPRSARCSQCLGTTRVLRGRPWVAIPRRGPGRACGRSCIRSRTCVRDPSPPEWRALRAVPPSSPTTSSARTKQPRPGICIITDVSGLSWLSPCAWNAFLSRAMENGFGKAEPGYAKQGTCASACIQVTATGGILVAR
jgi:hypothetical protein